MTHKPANAANVAMCGDFAESGRLFSDILWEEPGKIKDQMCYQCSAMCQLFMQKRFCSIGASSL